jgi:hypothetical protein
MPPGGRLRVDGMADGRWSDGRSRSPGGVAVCRRTTVADVHPDASDGRLLDAIFPMDVQSDNPALSVVPFLI